MKNFFVGLVTLALASTMSAVAGPVSEVNLSAQPLQYSNDGVLTGCGIRLVGIQVPVEGQKKIPVLDVSFNVINPGAGLIKGGLMDLSVKAMLAGDLNKTVEVPITNLWFKAPNSPTTKPTRGQPLKTQTHKHALMYATSLDSVLPLVSAMHEGKPIQVGFMVTAEKMEKIYFGKIQIGASENAQFTQCFDEWSHALMKPEDEAPKTKD